MGYNRSGERRKQRLKRQKREFERILAKQEAAAAAESHGDAVAKVKGGAKGAAAKAGESVKAVAHKATGH
jgi:hypothetical protein